VTVNWADAGYFLPEGVMALTFLACVVLDLVYRGKRHHVTALALWGGTVLSLAVAVSRPPQGSHFIFGQMVVVDEFAHFFRVLFLGITLLVTAMSWASREIMGRDREHQGEYYSFLAVLCLGMMVMAESTDLLMLALSIELVSVTSYIMAGYARFSLRSTEASLKYVLYGAVSSGVMLFGAAIFFGLTGQTGFTGIQAALSSMAGQPGHDLALLVATLFVLAGIGYKISAVPFHFWAPDVYEGSPTPITALFAAGPKAAGFALLIRFFYTTLVQPAAGPGTLAVLDQIQWPWLLALMSAVTMTYGNLAALRQDNIKRMLAYSSIAHVGYLLMGFVLLSEAGLQAILFYLLVYALMNLGAFLVVIALNNRMGSENIEDYAGLGYREPLVAVAMTTFLFSLTGLPPTAGFIGKFYLFAAVVENGMWWLALLGVLNSVISLYYYMRVPKAMYFTHTPQQGGLGLARMHVAILLLLAIPTVLLGLYWSPFKALADSSLRRLMGG
jgi:NADH-quinone oxidoreductase subunit N